MKLREITVHELYGGYDCSLSLHKDGLTFLHSLNGTGKSTILRMINAVFNGDEKTLEDIPFGKLSLSFYEGTTVKVMKNPDTDFVISTGESNERVKIGDLKGFADVLYISPERTTVSRDGALFPAIEEYFAEFKKTYNLAKNDTELKTPKKLIEEDDDRFVHFCKNLRAKLEYINDVGFDVSLPADIKFPPNRYEFSENRERYVSVVSSLSEWIEDKYRLAESITVYLDVVNGLFINKNLSIDSENNAICLTLRDKTPMPAKGLSAGEKQILILFYRLLFHAKDGSLVFIDEPEISLHVSWQQSLGSIFGDICRTRNLQMLVATHSPQIIHDKWDLATELRSELA